MSGEETDDSSNTVNTVNRLWEKRLLVRSARWLNSDIRRLFEIIDTYETALDDRGFYSTRGPVPYVRVKGPPEQCRVIPRGTKIAGLPRNWYDDSWYRTQNEGEQILLGAIEGCALPILVSPIGDQSNAFASSHHPFDRNPIKNQVPVLLPLESVLYISGRLESRSLMFL